MSVVHTVYVGPYLFFRAETVPDDFDWDKWDDVVCLVEFDEPGLNPVMLPNQDVLKRDRPMEFHKHDAEAACHISHSQMVTETAAFARLTDKLIAVCDAAGIEIYPAWGVVSYWS